MHGSAKSITNSVNTVYYHVVMLTFRPFLLDRSAAQGRTSTQISGQMWLRQACRYATDAAQDSIVFISDKIRTTDACKVSAHTMPLLAKEEVTMGQS